MAYTISLKKELKTQPLAASVRINPSFTLNDQRMYGAIYRRTEHLQAQGDALARLLDLSNDVFTNLANEANRKLLPQILDKLEEHVTRMHGTVKELRRMDEAAKVMQQVASERA